MQNKKFGAFSSSEDSQKLGDTVKAVILGLGVVIIFALHQMGINIGTDEISSFAIGAGTAITQIMLIYGILKKFFVWLYARYQEKTK